MKLDIPTAQAILKDAHDFLQKHKHWLCEWHVIHLLADGLWGKMDPTWRETLASLSDKELNALPTCMDTPITWPPSLVDYIDQARRLEIHDETHYDIKKVPKALQRGIRPKKMYELSIFVPLVAQAMEKEECIVDIGGGLGHLGHILAAKHDFRVLSIDASKQLIERGVQRWKSLDSSSQWTGMTKTLGEDTEFEEMLEAWHDGAYGLVALHPCGNLGSTLLRVFLQNKNASSLVMASCCYNLLTESYAKSVQRRAKTTVAEVIHGPPPPDASTSGFPLSKLGHQLFLALGDYARMLACQSIDVWSLPERIDASIHKLQYRAALEVLFWQVTGRKDIAIGRLNDNQPFVEYAQAAFAAMDVSVEKGMIEQVWDSLEPQLRHVHEFWALRAVAARALESVVIVDRCLFLLEHGIDIECKCVFDTSISPRAWVIQAHKRT